MSFRHLYFSPDRRGERAHDDAMSALAEIGSEPDGPKATTDLADRFMFQDHYGDRTPEDLEREFGAQFASAVLKLQPGVLAGSRRVGLRLAPRIRRFCDSRPHSRFRGSRSQT